MTLRPAELIARLIGVVALLAALVAMMRGPSALDARDTGTLAPGALSDSSGGTAVRELTAMLARSAGDTARPKLHITLSRIPDAKVRNVLTTARAVGMDVGWSDSTAAVGLAVAASAEIDPQGGNVVRAGGNGSQPLLVRDGVGLLDSVGNASAGVVVRGVRLSGEAIAQQGTSRATTPVPRAATVRRLLLAARPGWEAKFVTAALEERGWQVDGRLVIARRASVTVGAPAALDTARYAAAIVLDSGVIGADALTRFVRQGGGVILAGEALSAPATASLRPASIVGVRAAVPGALLTAAPRQGLDAFELRPAARAIVLQHEPRGLRREPSVVAWRIGAGRVIASAYRETWRWRMEGTDEGIDEHRKWWSALVSAAAFVPTDSASARASTVATHFPGSAAPYADLVARLGAPSPPPASRMASPSSASMMWILFVAASIALLTEWALRRLRGAP